MLQMEDRGNDHAFRYSGQLADDLWTSYLPAALELVGAGVVWPTA